MRISILLLSSFIILIDTFLPTRAEQPSEPIEAVVPVSRAKTCGESFSINSTEEFVKKCIALAGPLAPCGVRHSFFAWIMAAEKYSITRMEAVRQQVPLVTDLRTFIRQRTYSSFVTTVRTAVSAHLSKERQVANWISVMQTLNFRRTAIGYSPSNTATKRQIPALQSLTFAAKSHVRFGRPKRAKHPYLRNLASLRGTMIKR